MNPIFFVLCTLLLASAVAGERLPWTTSRIQGSPEKPPNYRVSRLFPSLTFTNPVDIAFNRSLQRWFVAEQGGKLYTFDKEGNDRQLAADFRKVQGPEGNLYAFTFDPNFASNRFVYVCYVLKSDLPEGSHVSRFKLKSDPVPEIDLKSEELLITWLSGGHNGCGLQFGRDGYLYISTGDGAGPNPPDPLHTGQDVSDLLSSLLRIDVHHPGNGKKYSIPADNPFIGRPNTRPEIWAFGFRNPWRFGIDKRSGDIWVADVGWELGELIYRVRRGGNYGWSIVEGRQPVNTTDPSGPGPILPPVKDHPHSEAASITGGIVYHGKKFPQLEGAFLYGDWETGKIWGIRAENDQVTFSEELTDTTIRVVAFAEDPEGEPIVLDYNGGLYALETNPSATLPQNFPTKLSETGLFTSTARHEIQPGVTAFRVNAEMWSDYAKAERFIALPGLTTITNLERPWRYPSNAVLVRTISLEMERGQPESTKRLETQILHFNGDGWGAYSYRWNEEQTDATLVPAEGSETILKIRDTSEPGGTRVQAWRFHSRAECLRCHNPWCGTALGFQPEQLSRKSLDDLAQFFSSAPQLPEKSLVDPYDGHADLAKRARSYLHVNCSACHRENAGGSVPAVMNIELADEKMHMLDQRPTRGTLDLVRARVIAPNEPFSSVALFRASATGRSRMPYIGSRLVDEQGIALLREWIGPARLDTIRSALVGADSELVKLAATETITTSSALRLAHAAAHPSVSPAQRERLAHAALKSSNPLVRELFERFLPADARTVVSQTIAPRHEVLALKGDATRGATLLADSARLSCLQCHQYQNAGRNFGPDLRKAIQNKSRAEILDNILEPSRQIAPEYVLYIAEMDDDEQVSGIVVRRDPEKIVLRDASAIDHEIATVKLKSLKAQQLSAMPEGLLAGLSAQDVADLLEALVSPLVTQ